MLCGLFVAKQPKSCCVATQSMLLWHCTTNSVYFFVSKGEGTCCSCVGEVVLTSGHCAMLCCAMPCYALPACVHHPLRAPGALIVPVERLSDLLASLAAALAVSAEEAADVLLQVTVLVLCMHKCKG